MCCKKECFSKREAVGAISQNNRKKHHRERCWRKECRIYYCEEHNAWHLTSMEEYIKPILEPLIYKNKWKKMITVNQ
jgi:hypothetical protein